MYTTIVISCCIVQIHNDMDLFDCVRVIIIVPKPSLGDWISCVCARIDCDGFDSTVRLKEEPGSTTVRCISVKGRNSP